MKTTLNPEQKKFLCKLLDMDDKGKISIYKGFRTTIEKVVHKGRYSVADKLIIEAEIKHYKAHVQKLHKNV